MLEQVIVCIIFVTGPEVAGYEVLVVSNVHLFRVFVQLRHQLNSIIRKQRQSTHSSSTYSYAAFYQASETCCSAHSRAKVDARRNFLLAYFL